MWKREIGHFLLHLVYLVWMYGVYIFIVCMYVCMYNIVRGYQALLLLNKYNFKNYN